MMLSSVSTSSGSSACCVASFRYTVRGAWIESLLTGTTVKLPRMRMEPPSVSWTISVQREEEICRAFVVDIDGPDKEAVLFKGQILLEPLALDEPSVVSVIDVDDVVDYIGSWNVCSSNTSDVYILLHVYFTKGNLISTLTSDIAELLRHGLFCDVVLIPQCLGDDARQVEVKAHKAVLSARSPYFRKLFETPMKEAQENVVKLMFHPDVLNIVLNFIYNDEPGDMEALVLEVLAAADYFGIDRLKSICERNLTSKVTTRNVLELLSLADRHMLSILRRRSIDFVASNLEAVMESPLWNRIDKDEKNKILEEVHVTAAKGSSPTVFPVLLQPGVNVTRASGGITFSMSSIPIKTIRGAPQSNGTTFSIIQQGNGDSEHFVRFRMDIPQDWMRLHLHTNDSPIPWLPRIKVGFHPTDFKVYYLNVEGRGAPAALRVHYCCDQWLRRLGFCGKVVDNVDDLAPEEELQYPSYTLTNWSSNAPSRAHVYLKARTSRGPHISCLNTDLEQLLNEEAKHLCDVALTVKVPGVKHLLAHRAILCARCPVFRTVIRSVEEESGKRPLLELNVDLPEDILALVLVFIYTDRVDVGGREAALIAAAHQLELHQLKWKCAERLLSQPIELDRVLGVLALAEQYGLDFLLTTAIAVAAEMREQVMRLPDWEAFANKHVEIVSRVVKTSIKSNKRKRAGDNA